MRHLRRCGALIVVWYGSLFAQILCSPIRENLQRQRRRSGAVDALVETPQR